MENNDPDGNGKSPLGLRFEFFILVGVALILSFIPFVNLPFTWVMTFFHEMSHGIAAWITGGSVESIELHLGGSGLCHTIGGSRLIIGLSGYVGAVIWGVLLYEMADTISQKYTRILSFSLAGFVAISALLYARDLFTWLVLLVLFGLFAYIPKLQTAYLVKLSLKFVGIYVVLDAVRAPLHLIDGRNIGDGAILSDQTGIPELLWVILWLTVGVLGIGYLWKQSRNSVKSA